MVTNVLIILVIICNITNGRLNYALETLDTKFDEVTKFFEQLGTKYEYESLNKNILHKIDNEINSYNRNTINRQKRQLPNSLNDTTGINILEGFDEISTFNVQDFKHATFFSYLFKENLFWFMANIGSEGISFYRYNNGTFDYIESYSQYNGKRIIVNNFDYNTVVIIQNFNESIVILKFTYNYTTSQTSLSFVQTLEISAITDIHTWHYMNHLYLGIASQYNISICAWLGEHFDVMQVLNFNAEKLMFFQNKGFMNLICITSRTVILRYFFQFNKFVTVQTLPVSNAIIPFDIKKDHLEEHFICLSSSKHTIIYKEIHGHFVPFQEIPTTKKIIPIVVDKAIALLLVNENITTTYQYDGWKFVQLSTKLLFTNDVYLIKVDEEELIITRHGVTTWKLVKPKWEEKKSLHSLKNDIMSWCLEAKVIAQRLPKVAQIFRTPLHISNSYIREINTQNLNGHNTKLLEKLTKQYKHLAMQFEKMNDSLNRKIYNTNSKFKTIHAKKVQVTCKSSCKVNNMVLEEKDNALLKLRSVRNIIQNLTFANLQTKRVNNFKCPTPAFIPHNLYLKQSINNVSLSDLQENTLKISGDQVVTGDHVFVELDTVHSIMPLDIATNFTTQTVHAKEIRVKELNLKKGGFLLPLNEPSTKILKHLRASKVTVKGYIDLKGGLKGEGAKSLMPVKQIQGVMEINGDRNLKNVKIVNILKTKDIYRKKGKSLKYILDNAISLDINNLTQHLIFSSNVEWKNVTIKDYYNKWITAHSKNKVIITGKKQTTHNITLTQSSHTMLTIPKLNFPLCGSNINIPNIKLSQMEIENIIAQNLNSFHISGAKKLNSTIFGTILSIDTIDTIDLSKKYFIGDTNVKNILPFDIKGFNVKGFQEIINVWRGANIFKHIKNATHLRINTLQAPIKFEFSLPTTVRNVISKRNTYVGTINGVNFKDFMKNVVKTNDINSLNNITFSTGFISDNLQFLHGPFNLAHSGVDPHFHSKHILGKLETEKLNIQKPIIHNTYNTSTNFIIQGNVTFISEPTIHNVNNLNLNQLSSEIYKIDENMVISGKNFEIKNMIVKKNNISQNSLRIPYYDTWSNLSHNLLSKTKPQEIIVACWFNDIEVNNITGSKNLSIKTFDPDIKNMIEMSLKKNESQRIRSKWHLEKLILPGYVNLKGKINNLYLKTDVVKRNTKENIVTGKKTILELATKHLYDSNFSKWSQNAVLLNQQELIVIKGQKVFTDINIQDLSLDGTIMGKKIENALLKSKSQIITGAKILNGSIAMPGVLLDGLVNDVNFTSFTKYLLKKNKPVQRFMTNITLKDNLEVQGNIFIEDLYNDVKINNLSVQYKKMESAERDLERVAKVVKGAEIALNNRAFYVNKLKIYKNITATSNINNSNQLNNSQCELKNVSLFCNNVEVQGFSLGSDISNYTTVQVVTVKKNMIVVSITADCVSIYASKIMNTRFHRKKVFCVPNILRASIESLGNSLWIILQLPTKMLALHYVQWDDMEQYILPPSDVLITSTPPDKELLMIRSDGVWSLGELGSPHHIVKKPLTENIETFSYGKEYYIKNTKNNDTIFMRPIYAGN